MIDIKRTTLVPSYRALEAFKDRGELDELATEYRAERAAVAAHLSRPESDVIVELSPAAIAVKAPELHSGAAEPGIRRRLVRIHVIHPDTDPVSEWRELYEGAIGLSRHPEGTWLWVGGEDVKALIKEEFTRRRIGWASPIVSAWPVVEATILPVGLDLKSLLSDLGQEFAIVDVDRNGRPFPPVPSN